jgi:hypothetical protein
VEVFERAISRRRFTAEQDAMLREAYVEAVRMLGITTPEQRLRLARIILRLGRIERFPGAHEIATIAVDWHAAGRMR